MIQIFPPKSGFVSLLPLLSYNFMPNFGKILWPVIEKGSGLTDRRTNGRTKGRTDKWTNGRRDKGASWAAVAAKKVLPCQQWSTKSFNCWIFCGEFVIGLRGCQNINKGWTHKKKTLTHHVMTLFAICKAGYACIFMVVFSVSTQYSWFRWSWPYRTPQYISHVMHDLQFTSKHPQYDT